MTKHAPTIHPSAITARIKAKRGDATRAHSEDVLRRLYAEQNPKQLAFLQDRSRFKSVTVGRRGGKTRVFGAGIVETAERIPGARIKFGTLTLKRSKALMWRGRDGLKVWDKRLGLKLDFNNSDLIATWPNGSMCELVGFETLADVAKYRGDGDTLVILDECGFFPLDLFKELVNDAIIPSLGDDLGSLWVGGTPGAVQRGEFWEATSDEGQEIFEDAVGQKRQHNRPAERIHDPELADVKPTWIYHYWSVKDNIAKPWLFDEAMEQMHRRGLTIASPTIQREVFGRWASDDTALVYKYNSDKMGWVPGDPAHRGAKIVAGTNPHGLPEGHTWKFVCGLDFGSLDPTAISVLAYSATHPAFFHVDDHKESHLALNGVCELYWDWERRFGKFVAVVGDRTGKQFFDSIAEKGIPIQPSEQHQKDDYIDIFNGDLLDGHGFIKTGSETEQEMFSLVWDMKKLRRVEDRRCANHACDATLYAWRHALHRFARAKPKALDPDSREAQMLATAEEKRLACRVRKAVLDDRPRFQLDRPARFH